MEQIKRGLQTLSKEEYNILIDYYIKDLKMKEMSGLYGMGYKALESKKEEH